MDDDVNQHRQKVVSAGRRLFVGRRVENVCHDLATPRRLERLQQHQQHQQQQQQRFYNLSIRTHTCLLKIRHTLQQLRMHKSFSRGARNWLIFASSLIAKRRLAWFQYRGGMSRCSRRTNWNIFIRFVKYSLRTWARAPRGRTRRKKESVKELPSCTP